jgi:hypothetical protein
MKLYNELKTEIKTILQHMVDGKKNERADVFKDVTRLCKELGFTTRIFKG